MNLPSLPPKSEETAVKSTENLYFEGYSEKFGILQVVLYLCLFGFVVLSFLSNTELITYQNFYRFFKDLNTSAEIADVFDNDSVSYSADGNQSFTLYRKGLAVAGNSSVSLFTSTGRQTLQENASFENPVAVGSGKYLLVYELGGTRYALYSSYAKMFDGKSDYPITGGTVSESGIFALISSSEEHRSVVSIWSGNFSLRNRFNLDSAYSVDVAINAKGTLAAILISEPTPTGFSSRVMLLEPGKKTERAVCPIEGGLGLTCSFTSGGSVIAVCTGGVSGISSMGKLLSHVDFEGADLLSVDNAVEGSAIALRSVEKNQKNRLIVFDKSGKVLYNGETDEEILSIGRSGDSVFLLQQDGVTRINLQKGNSDFLKCETTDMSMLAVSENEILLCSSKKAVYRTMDS